MIGYGVETQMMKHAEATAKVSGAIARTKQLIVRQLQSQGGGCNNHKIKMWMGASGDQFTYRLALDSLVKDQVITEQGGSVRLHPEKVRRDDDV